MTLWGGVKEQIYIILRQITLAKVYKIAQSRTTLAFLNNNKKNHLLIVLIST